jgi:hypothetical protein
MNSISKTFENLKVKNSFFYVNTNKPFFILHGVGDLNENGIEFLRSFSCELKGIYFTSNSNTDKLSNYCAYLSLNNFSDEILYRGKFIDINTGDYIYSLVMPVYEKIANNSIANSNLNNNNNNLADLEANYLAYVYSVDLNLREIERKYPLNFNLRPNANADIFSKSGDTGDAILNKKVEEAIKNFYIRVTQNSKSSIFNNECVLSVFRNDSKCVSVNQACLNLLNPKTLNTSITNINNTNENVMNNNTSIENNILSNSIKIDDLKIKKVNFISHSLCKNKKTFYENNQILKREEKTNEVKIEKYIPPPCNCKTFSSTNIIIICIAFIFLVALIILSVLFCKKKNYCLKKKTVNTEIEIQVSNPNNSENNISNSKKKEKKICDVSRSSNKNIISIIKPSEQFQKLDTQANKSENRSNDNFRSSNICIDQEKKGDNIMAEQI